MPFKRAPNCAISPKMEKIEERARIREMEKKKGVRGKVTRAPNCAISPKMEKIEEIAKSKN